MTAFLGSRPSGMAHGVSGCGGERVVETDHLGKSFGRTAVLRDFTVRVTAGETVAIFGPNGAGKSTLLRLFASLTTPTAGTLRLFGDTNAGPATRRRIGMVAHQSFLYPDLTARENLCFFARMYGIVAADPCADAWLERVALRDVGDRPVRLFSRGMEQRLALARALLHDPDLIILDEPWSGLDAAAADWLAVLLRELRTHGRTVVVATHDFQRALDVATRALIVHRGGLAWDAAVAGGTASDVEATYREITGAVAA